MPQFSADELETAFRWYWRTGAVGEEWDAWADLFTEDAGRPDLRRPPSDH